MTTYAIGDVQGCYDELQRLLEHIGFSDDDVLWFAGDLVNRGPKSLQTVEFVRALGPRAICVLGNHDLHLLAAAHNARPPGKSDTFKDILQSANRDELLDWLRRCPLMHRDAHRVLVHAGIYPGWNIDVAEARAREVESVLREDDYARFFPVMYGNEPAVWHEQLAGSDRLRFIVNSFTRMRFVSSGGALDMDHSGPVGSQPDTLMPWFRLPHCRPADSEIYFGHWAALGQSHCAGIQALDSGCVWGNALTAIELASGQRYSVSCP